MTALSHRIARGARRLTLAAALACAAPLALGTAPALAQSQFSPVIRVNDMGITGYELQQRARFLTLLRAPGVPEKLAREQLIDDRLKMQAARALGVSISGEEIIAGMTEFASRANLSAEDFIKALKQGGVEQQTFEDFVAPGLLWRKVARAKFGPSAVPNYGAVTRAKERAARGSNLRVLLSEIIMPATPAQMPGVMARAARISELRSTAAFSAEARRYSATPTRGNGGKLPWKDLSELPPAIQPMISKLAPGAVTDPITLPGAVALFQLRDIQEGPWKQTPWTSIDYAAYYIAGGRSEQALATAAKVRGRIDTCDDLYGVAKGQPRSVLDRKTLPIGQLPTDIAYELSKLDPGETSTALTRSNGQTLMLLMLCERKLAPVEDGPSDKDIANALVNESLGRRAEAYLQKLRANARIR